MSEIGIIEIYEENDSKVKKNLMVKMGYIDDLYSSIGPKIKESLQDVFDGFMKYKVGTPIAVAQFVGKEEFQKPKIVCKLIFESGLLDHIEWPKDDAGTFEELSTARLEMALKRVNTSGVGVTRGWSPDGQEIYKIYRQGIIREGKFVFTGAYELQTLVGDGTKSALQCEKVGMYAIGIIY